MKQYRLIFILVAFTISMASCDAQKNDMAAPANSLDSFIMTRLDGQYKKHAAPGIFVAVLDSNQRRFYTIGYADPDKKMLFDSSTIFEIGSVTKTFTAFVLETVLKEKGINDSSSIIKYLPDSVQANKALEKISFLSLLNHSSGLARLPQNMDLNTMAPYDGYTAANLFSYLKNCFPKPDGKSNYSNLGVALAGVLAQRISGKTYKSLLNEYVFFPFKMDTANKTFVSSGNKSQGYFENDKAGFWNMDVMMPCGGIKSSANEMLTYLQQVAIPPNDKSKEIISLILQPTANFSPGYKVCRSWLTVQQMNQPLFYWHNGGTYGFSTFAGFASGRQKAVFVVANKFNVNAVTDELGMLIMKRLLE